MQKTLLPPSPALTELSLEGKDIETDAAPIDWVTATLGPDFGEEIQQGLKPAGLQEGTEVICYLLVNGMETKVIVERSGKIRTLEFARSDFQDSNAMEEDSDEDTPLSVLLAREIKERRPIAKLPSRAVAAKVAQHVDKHMLAQASSDMQGAEYVQQAVGPVEKPSTWTMFGRTYATVEAARSGSASIPRGPEMSVNEPQTTQVRGETIDLTLTDIEDSDADGPDGEIEAASFEIEDEDKEDSEIQMLARAPVGMQGTAPPVPQAVEPAERPSTCTRFGRTYTTVGAARLGSASLSLGPNLPVNKPQDTQARREVSDLTMTDGEDSDADGETDDGAWEICDEDIIDLEMDDEGSDADTESAYEPSGAEEDFDSDEDAYCGKKAGNWTEARALW